jgi:peptide/nickel transport system permease protein
VARPERGLALRREPTRLAGDVTGARSASDRAVITGLIHAGAVAPGPEPGASGGEGAGVLRYVVHRLVIMVPTLLAISLITFVIIQLPPGDYLESYIAELQSQGENIQGEKIEYLRQVYGLDRPWWQQYLVWLGGLFRGDFGYSFEYDLPVNEVVGDRLLLSFIVSFSTILFTWAVSFPIGVYSATHKYSAGDHALTFLGFLGLATPNFLLALVLLYFANVVFGTSIGGLMDPKYLDHPMSLAKFLSVLEHLWVPVIVIGTSGTAGMIRRLRANLLDELQKPYYVTAKAKGLPPLKALFKYPLRMSLNPFIADIGNLLPQVISGAAVVSIVLSLPTTGPMLLRALQTQDMYLAGSFLMLLAMLTVFGVLLSDVALAVLDPRIRFGGSAR